MMWYIFRVILASQKATLVFYLSSLLDSNVSLLGTYQRHPIIWLQALTLASATLSPPCGLL